MLAVEFVLSEMDKPEESKKPVESNKVGTSMDEEPVVEKVKTSNFRSRGEVLMLRGAEVLPRLTSWFVN